MADSKGLEDVQDGKFSSPTKELLIFRAVVNSSPSSQDKIESNYDESTDSFDAMSLKSELLRGMF